MTWSAEDVVLWSDMAIVVANKPAGLLVIRGGFASEPYLAHVLEASFGRLWVVHRLDRETSGVVVFARCAAAHRDLNTQFQERDVAKLYHALVVGVPPWDQLEVDLALRRDGDRRHRTVVDAQGKPSLTQFRILEQLGGYALLEAVPRTGRTHQIRAHLFAIGYPIVGDGLYGGGAEQSSATFPGEGEGKEGTGPPLIARCALHALSITFAHPSTGERLAFSAPYPDDLARALTRLGANVRD